MKCVFESSIRVSRSIDEKHDGRDEVNDKTIEKALMNDLASREWKERKGGGNTSMVIIHNGACQDHISSIYAFRSWPQMRSDRRARLSNDQQTNNYAISNPPPLEKNRHELTEDGRKIKKIRMIKLSR